MVARRRNEIGIRIALGASVRTVVGMIVAESARLVAVGVVVGVALAVAGAKAAASLLFGVTAADPGTMALALAAMTGVALLASALPAMRAARLDPTEALRDE
jgi:ABC-type antimicrobial peptide transport system permease subunit